MSNISSSRPPTTTSTPTAAGTGPTGGPSGPGQPGPIKSVADAQAQLEADQKSGADKGTIQKDMFELKRAVQKNDGFADGPLSGADAAKVAADTKTAIQGSTQLNDADKKSLEKDVDAMAKHKHHGGAAGTDGSSGPTTPDDQDLLPSS